MKKQRLSNIQEFGYIFYIENEQILSWAMYNRLRAYMENPNDGTHGDKDIILKGDCRVFVEAVNALDYMKEYNLGIFQEEIDQLYKVFLKRIKDDQEMHSYGFMD